jgi:hypothetical protein
MYVQHGITLPIARPKRRRIFIIRLSDAERADVKALAKRLKLPDSYLARHFILERVMHFEKSGS